MESKDLKELLGQSAREIISTGLNLSPNKSGMILCPLHSEKTPSMSWFKNGLMWRCHACGEKIDIYRYYTEFEGMSFIQAKEKVMDLTGQTELNVFAPSNRAVKKA